MLRPALLFSVFLTVSTTAAAAQSPLSPAAGDQVRVKTGGLTERYTVIQVSPDTLTLRGAAGGPLAVAVSDTEQIELSLGRRTATAGAVRGAALGLLVGGGAGLLIGYASGDDEPGILAFSAGEKALIAGMLLGGSGVVVGGLVGAIAPGERWQRVDRSRLGLAPGRAGGLAISLTHRF